MAAFSLDSSPTMMATMAPWGAAHAVANEALRPRPGQRVRFFSEETGVSVENDHHHMEINTY
jgi:hypothetical protein